MPSPAGRPRQHWKPTLPSCNDLTVVSRSGDRDYRSPTRLRRESAHACKLSAEHYWAGINFEWHFGRVTSLGVYEMANSRTVTILWEEGGVSNQQGEITDVQWEIFKLAFVGAGRIAILSDQEDKHWMYDYRFLEALRG